MTNPNKHRHANANANTPFVVARYLGNGSLDPSFGSGGMVKTAFGAESYARSVALQPDGCG